MSLLKSYQTGDYIDIWEHIRSVPNTYACENADIRDVAKATMERVKQNADLISGRLRDWGWEALDIGSKDLRVSPSPSDRAILDEIVEITGAALPLSLQTFWEIVGGINWVWNYESNAECPDLGVDVPFDEMDPLCVEPPRSLIYQLKEWESGEHHLVTSTPEGFYRLDLAPDYLHKANVSGGGPYGFTLPSNDPDPVFETEPKDLYFLDYLRWSFKWAGFPRLNEFKNEPQVQEFLSEFRIGLIDF